MLVRGLVSWILNRRLIILILWTLLVALAGLYLIRFLLVSEAPIDNSVSIWFQQNDPELIRYRQFNEDFGAAEWTILLLKTAIAKDHSITDDLAALTAGIESIPHVQKAISMADFLPDPGVVSVPGGTSSDPRWDLTNSRYSRLEGILYRAHDAEHSVVLIKVDNFIDARTKYRVQVLDRIRELTADQPWVKDYALAGTLVINAELNRASERNAIVFYLLISGLLILLSLLTVRCNRDTLVLLAIVVGTVLPVMAGLALSANSYNMLTIMLPTMLAAFSVADIVHVIDHFHKERLLAWKSRKPADTNAAVNSSAIMAAMEQLWRPGLWTSLTTAMGLLALSNSDVIPIFQIGVAGAVGIFWAWTQTVIVGPALLGILWDSHDESSARSSFKTEMQNQYRRLVDWLVGLHLRHPRKLLMGLFLMVLPVFALPWLEVDTNYARFFRSNSTLPADYAKMESAGIAQNPVSVQVSIKDGKDISSPGIFQAMLQFESGLELLAPVEAVFSASTLMEAGASLLVGNDQDLQVSTEQGRQMAALLLAAAKGNDYRQFEDFITPDGQQIQILVMTNYLSSKGLDALKAEIMKTASDTLPRDDVSVSITGTTVLWSSMDKHISKTQLHSIIFSFAFMGLLLLLVFRSLKLGLVGIAVNFLPVSISLGVMSLVDIKVNIATALIGSIAFGIVVDDTIHFLMRFTRNRALGMSVARSIEDTCKITGHSIITTSLILAGSFITLASSSFLPSVHFGIFIALSVSLALYLDILILPILLRFLFRKSLDDVPRYSSDDLLHG